MSVIGPADQECMNCKKRRDEHHKLVAKKLLDDGSHGFSIGFLLCPTAVFVPCP